MVPPYSVKISRVPTYLFIYLVPHSSFRVRGYHSLRLSFPAYSTILYAKLYKAVPPSLAATKGISVDFCSYRYLDVSVPYVRLSIYLNIKITALWQLGSPIRISVGQCLFASSPQLFASYYVLRRL
jgi:hypothetical protein